MNIVAHMLVRNEADIIAETVHEVFRWVDTLIVLDGDSTDLTTCCLAALSESLPLGKTLAFTSQPDPSDGEDAPVNLNVLRSELLRMTAEFSPDWVFSIDADEIYDDQGTIDPVTAILAAEEAGANVVRCLVPEFWLTFDDLRHGALHEDESISIQLRRRWYSWGHMGTFIWKWNDDHYYPPAPSKRTPELPGLNWRQWQIAGPLMPVCKHYPIRTLRQGLQRMDERLARGGRWQFGKYGLPNNLIIDEKMVGLHHYDGHWQTESNHARLKAYMAGELT
jgi:hypothetical protein